MRRNSPRQELGAATAEFAVVLPVVVAVVALLLLVARTATVAMACQDAAGVVVRELTALDTREGDREVAERLVRQLAGAHTQVSITYETDTMTVRTQCPVVPDPLGVLPEKVTGEAVGIVTQGGGI